jgi:hypothetical protein
MKEGRQRQTLQVWLARLVEAMHGRIHAFNPLGNGCGVGPASSGTAIDVPAGLDLQQA